MVRGRRPIGQNAAMTDARSDPRGSREPGPWAGLSDTQRTIVLALLRQARAARTRLRLRLAAGDGGVQERTVRVLAVESGRARLADLDRETELTAALHRIVSVEPDPAAPSAR